jgi:DNA-binding transcriptional regulator LsrR (DeoR family)
MDRIEELKRQVDEGLVRIRTQPNIKPEDRKQVLAKFLEWRYEMERLKIGRTFSQTKWAKQYGINPSSMSMYMTEQRMPEGDSVYALAFAFGDTIFDIVGDGGQPVDPRLRFLASIWERVPETRKRTWVEEARASVEADRPDLDLPNFA